MSTAPVMTRAGDRTWAAVEPTPIWPLRFHPQAYTSPDAVRATPCSRPPSICTTNDRPATAFGTRGGVTVPSPSSPDVFAPQLTTVPAVTAA